ncbi:PREDICTED: uncharacterized protein LOC108560438 [Nicrophorus vespilloides]|uniref:Uncharacterized protein LOC108560438 n=1 Tax=Nicrophorus vespilloides TaxID=110193 RepID=A0ABM1MFW2_NICVS|nr:PREDICTED: uncharacterized protein LOC108560438 [Nicrophorus vespilloides]
MHCKQMKLLDVWRICNKIRSAIFRVGFNLWDYYLPLDPHKNCLISESAFVSVLSGSLRSTIGLSDYEIGELTDYFRVQDGRIFYTQFCEVIHDSIPEFSKNANLVTGLEWEDPLHVNRLSTSEERRLSLLITKISVQVNLRKLVLRPFFQDYELVAKNNGTVTIAHFARVLAYLDITVSSDDFNLLVKKYMKDSYTLNYVAFVADIEATVDYLERHGCLDLGGDIMSQFPGRVINAELPKLPRPEIGKIMAASVFGKQSIFHPALNAPSQRQSLLEIIRRIQRHVLENRIRISDFFEGFDSLGSGKITASQFHRGLDAVGISGLQRLYISLPEIKTISIQYQDPIDPTRVCWKTFADDIDQVFTVKNLERAPMLQVASPPREVKELPKRGTKSWDNVNPSMRDLCEETVEKVKNRIMRRRILLKPVFRNYDKHNNGHVSRSQMRQSLLSNGILLSDEELYALEERFNDDMGFNYFWFLKEAEPKPHEEALFTGFLEAMEKVNAEKPCKPVDRSEKDIILILAKIKGKVVRERIRVIEFLQDYDLCNQQVISRENFQRGLSNCRFDLSEAEVETLMNVFSSPMRPGCVDYKRFSEVVEEAFTQACMERAPLLMPKQHVPTKDCARNFLNFDERRTFSIGIQKLSKKPDLQMNLMSIFKDYDRTNCGTISQEHFLKALSLRGMYNLISRTEFDMICKCFSFERGLRDEIDYRAFIKALDILYATDKYNPF